MSDPKKHHYLPEGYLRPWATDGHLWRFIRPRGPAHPVHAMKGAPGGVGYERELYSYPNPLNPTDKQAIEKDFMQRIDDLGAKAIRKVELNKTAGKQDKVDLVQFLLSMAFRSPRQIDFVHAGLKARLEDSDLFSNVDEGYFRHHALELMAQMIASDFLIERLIELRGFIISVGDDRHGLMTSDRPLVISSGLDHDRSFVMLPIGPRKLLILARDRKIPEAFASQETRALITALNDAVCSQAEQLVIGNKLSDRRFVDKRLQRKEHELAPHRDPSDGMVKWNAPIVTRDVTQAQSPR